MTQYSLTHLSDAVLLRDLRATHQRECGATAMLLAQIAEVDARRLYAPAGYSSMFMYCVEELRLSEDSAAKRIHAGRAARRFPALFEALAQGRLHLSAISLIAPHLTSENAEELIRAATHRRKSEIEELLARRFPSATAGIAASSIRLISPRVRPSPEAAEMSLWHVDAPKTELGDVLLATAKPASSGGLERGDASARGLERAEASTGGLERADGSTTGAPEHAPTPTGKPQGITVSELEHAGASTPRAEHAPAHVNGATRVAFSGQPVPSPASERYLVQVAIGKSTHDKLRHAQALLSHTVFMRDVEQVLDRALDALIEKLEKRKLGAGSDRKGPRRAARKVWAQSAGRKSARYIPAHVRREVWARDQGRCTFVSASGHRCGERRFLQFDHIEPVARGGRASVETLRLRCRAHNQLEAERAFGTEFMSRKRVEAQQARDEALKLRDGARQTQDEAPQPSFGAQQRGGRSSTEIPTASPVTASPVRRPPDPSPRSATNDSTPET